MNSPQNSSPSPQTPGPAALPTRGRVLVHAAVIYDAVQPLVTLGQEARLNRWLANKSACPMVSKFLMWAVEPVCSRFRLPAATLAYTSLVLMRHGQ